MPQQSSNAPLALDISHAEKTYRGRVRALRGISMRVERGAVFGLLGPNGAGKSTLVKILMTVIRPTHCRGTMLGQPVGHKPTLARIGYLPEHHRFPEYLTAWQVLDFYGALANVPRNDRRKRAGELLETVGLKDWKDKKVKSFSKGMRQRLGIANALVNDPDLVLLDEPTDGVDPVGRRDIRNILLQLKQQGKTIFLNSHLLSELEMVCDRVAILVRGEVSSQGTIDELTQADRRYDIEVQPADNADPRDVINAVLGKPFVSSATPKVPCEHEAQVGELPGGTWVQADGAYIRVGTNEASAIQPMIDALRAHGVVIRSIHAHRPSLEDLFMRAVTDPTTGKAFAPGAAKKGGDS